MGGGKVEGLVVRARHDDGRDIVEELADRREPDINLFYHSGDGPGDGKKGHLIGGVSLAD